MALKHNIVMDQGTTFSTSLTLKDDDEVVLDLTNYSGRAQMRKYYASNTYYSFTVNTDANGVVTLAMTANATSNIAAGRYVYDVELVDGSGSVSRIVEGMVIVTPEITR